MERSLIPEQLVEILVIVFLVELPSPSYCGVKPHLEEAAEVEVVSRRIRPEYPCCETLTWKQGSKRRPYKVPINGIPSPKKSPAFFVTDENGCDSQNWQLADILKQLPVREEGKSYIHAILPPVGLFFCTVFLKRGTGRRWRFYQVIRLRD